VADRDFLERIDRHMEQGNLHLERGSQLMAEIREEMRLSREQRERSEQMFAGLRAFMAEITRRVERGGREQVEELRELRAETRAQTQALLRVIDRMDRLDPGGSAA
jgi:predicted phage gp36 major capsid-like protein